MPDRYDPKLSVRPPADRKNPDGRGGQGPGGEDPLVELARIVSGRSAFENIAPKSEKPAPPPVSAPQALPSEADLARDLESELLNELQASFSTIPEIVGRPAPPPEPAPAPAPPPPQPPVVAQPKAQPAPLPQPMTFEASDLSASEAELDFRPPMATPVDAPARHPLAPAPARVEPQIRPPQGAAKRESLAARIARAAHGGEPTEAPPVRPEPPAAPRALVPQPPRPNAFKPPSAPGRADPAGAQFRPTLTPNPPPVEPPPRSPVTRWDPPPEAAPQVPFDLARFAPLGNEAPQRREPVAARPSAPEPEEFASEAVLPSVEEAFFDEEPDTENFDMVPGYGDEDLLPYPEEDLSAYEPRRPRRGPLAIAALLTVAVIGGAAAVMLRTGGTDETPPIITADSSPTKVEPDNTGAGDSEGQAKLIYDRVDPGSEVAGSELVVPGGDPIADIPPIPEDTGGNDVSRVILEGGPGPEIPAGDTDPMDLSEGRETTVAGSSPPEPEPIGPKKVRTVVVRPDGTIVSSAATATEETAETIPDLPPPSETPPAPAADENPLLADDFGVEAIDNPTPDTPAGDVASASVPDVPAPAPPPPTPAPAPPPAAKTSPPPKPPTVVAATGGANGPIDLTPGKTAPRIPAGSGGGFLVQVSSQRSQETALSTFRDLQRRYPGILGDREPNIQRADLGERGVYYRVRVGYPTRDEAVRMCENLKSAGGDCILATR